MSNCQYWTPWNPYSARDALLVHYLQSAKVLYMVPGEMGCLLKVPYVMLKQPSCYNQQRVDTVPDEMKKSPDESVRSWR